MHNSSLNKYLKAALFVLNNVSTHLKSIFFVFFRSLLTLASWVGFLNLGMLCMGRFVQGFRAQDCRSTREPNKTGRERKIFCVCVCT